MKSDYSYDYSILLGSAYRTLRVRVANCLEQHDLIPTHWSLIGAVYGNKDGITVSDAANLLGVTMPLITVMVDHLESKGLIQRVANVSDGRSKLLKKTKQGTKQVAIIEAELSKRLAPLLIGISEEQLKVFGAVLDAISRNDSEK